MHTKCCQLFLCCFLCLSFPVFAGSPVWKVSNDQHTVYIGGTFHLLAPEDYPLPRAFDLAYERAAVVVFETDIQQLANPRFQQQVNAVISLGKGQSLARLLKPKTYQMLESYLNSKKMSMDQIDKFTPVGVSLIITLMAYSDLGMQQALGVDQHFMARVKDDNKSQGQLETIEEQLQFIREIGKGDPDELIVQTLQELRSMKGLVKKMRLAWRKGDLKSFEKMAITPMRKEYPDIYQLLLVNRNTVWVSKVEAMLTTQAVELILVGALHLPGEKGLLQQLEARGYKVSYL